jgi:hypothetical protein
MVTSSPSFLGALYSEARDEQYLEVRLLNDGRPTLQQFIPVGTLRENLWVVPPLPSGYNVSFSVIPRARESGKGADCASALAVWADLDKPAARPMFPLPPSLVVSTSAGKHHVYWLLKEPCTDLSLIESINHAIAIQADGDSNACDRARVLRLPDYPNIKYQPNPPMVELLVNEPTRTYTVDELRTAWPEVQPIETYQRKTYTASRSAPSWLPLVFDAIVTTLLDRGYKGEQYGEYWKSQCCLHDDPKPSLYIHPVKGWHCFGCGEKGRLTKLEAILQLKGRGVILK